MATIRQRKLAKVIIENASLDSPMNAGQMLEKVGYSDNLVKQPGRVIDSEGVQEALEEYGFTEDNAKKVVSEIMLNEKVNPSDRLKATDQVFKVRGSYEDTRQGANRTMVINITGESAKRYGINPSTEDSSIGSS